MSDRKVTLYTSPTCPYCAAAKKYLEEKGIEYVELNAGNEKDVVLQMVAKTGQTGVPVLEIGDRVVVGFNQEEIEDALAEAY